MMNPRRGRRITLPLLWIAALTATAGPATADEANELSDLQMVLESVDHATPDLRLVMLAAGFEEVARSHDWEGTCEDAFGAYAMSPEAYRATQITAAFPGCQALCPSGPERDDALLLLERAPPLSRTEMLAAACDAAGAAPIFDGDLLPVRAQMSTESYWVFRAGFDLARQRLDAIGGEQAEELRAAYDALIPVVADDLARHLPPREIAHRLPETTSRRSPDPGPALVVREDVLILERQRIVETSGGEVPAGQLDGQKILPLFEALQGLHGEQGDVPLLIQMDGDLPTTVLERVVYSAGKAGFRRFQLAGIHATEARQTVSRVSLADLSRYLGTTGEMGDRPPLNLTLLLDAEGVAVAGSASLLVGESGASPRIEWDQEPDPYAELHDLLGLLKDEYPDEEEVIVAAVGDDIPYRRLMGVLDACREQEGGEQGRPQYLFPDVILAGGTGLPGSDGRTSHTGAIGGLIGAEGLGGLGTRGSSLGGGGGEGTGGGSFGPDAPDSLATGGPVILGAIDKDDIDEVIRVHLSQIRYCYQRELAKEPDLAGKVVVKFVIAKDGTVSSASTKTTTLENAAVEKCVLQRFMRMQFPEPRGGGIVIVSYPFLFKPAEGTGG